MTDIGELTTCCPEQCNVETSGVLSQSTFFKWLNLSFLIYSFWLFPRKWHLLWQLGHQDSCLIWIYSGPGTMFSMLHSCFCSSFYEACEMVVIPRLSILQMRWLGQRLLWDLLKVLRWYCWDWSPGSLLSSFLSNIFFPFLFSISLSLPLSFSLFFHIAPPSSCCIYSLGLCLFLILHCLTSHFIDCPNNVLAPQPPMQLKPFSWIPSFFTF